MRILLLIVSALLYLPTLINAQHGISYCWSVNPEYQLPKLISPASDKGGVANNMVIEPDGSVIVFWQEIDLQANVKDIVFAGTNDGGKTWNSPSLAYFSPAQKTVGASGISAATDNKGNIYVSWKAMSPEAVFFAYYNYNSKIWSDTVRISQYVNHKISFQNLTVDRKGRVHAMWHDGEMGSNQIAEVMYSRSVDMGNTWQSQTMLSNNDGQHSEFPVVDFSGALTDTLAIAWRDSTIDDWDVVMAVTYDGGQTWQASQTIAGGTNSQHDSYTIVDKNGLFHVLYDEYAGKGTSMKIKMMYGFSSDAGKTWQAGFKPVSDTAINSLLPKGAYDFTNDIVWLSWKDHRDFDQQTGNRKSDIMVMKVTDSGINWWPTEFVTDQYDKEVGYHNFIAGNDGTLKATYNYDFNTSDSLDLYYREYGCDENGSIINSIKEPELAQENVIVYPNPSSGEFTFQLNEIEEGANYFICNWKGQLIDKGSLISSETNSIAVSQLSNGFYSIYIQTPNTQYVKKVMILNYEK